MKCPLLLAVALLFCFVASSNAGRTRAYYTRAHRTVPTVSYYIDLTPRPIITRQANNGINRMPNNPVYTNRVSTPTPSRTYSRTYSTPVFGSPELIVNPFVDQTNFKGIGR